MKSISSAADLAINGAPPAFSQPVHVGRPNIGDRDAFLARVGEILDNQWLTNNGPMVQEFERRIASQLGVKHCVAMCNGTIALEIAIRALGLEGEVIIPSWTFIATAHALYWQGITPVFADIDPVTHNLDPDAVRRMITPKTTGIIGVHLWGRAAPIEELQGIADEHGLKLMFDAAHAFGCSYKGQTIGSFGACEVLSFHATKVFNSFEGGAVVTDNDELAEAMRLMRNFGFAGYDNVIYPGTNGKMPEINAAMGLVNLDALPNFVESNRVRYEAYAKKLEGIDGLRIVHYERISSPNYQYVVVELDHNRAGERDNIIAALHAENILARKYFWPGCHRMGPYRELFPHAGLMVPETESLSSRIIVLPTGASTPEETVEVVGQVFRLASFT
jgi:dTDP-4-amino-4,6-dideoxygalactose transaminase